MMRVRTRLGWALPILVLAALVVMLSALVGTAGGTTTTLVTTSATLPAGGLPEGFDTTPADTSTGASTEVFNIKASDLGDFTAEPPSLSSPAAIVLNMSTGRVLYSKKAEVRRPMASTTKIMTAILCLESLPMDQRVTISRKAAQTPEVKTFLREGDVLTVEQLLYSLLVHSSNAAAAALAESEAGSVDAFAGRMNTKAAELGMGDTSFINPNGLDADGHYSTPADMAKLGLYAMKNAVFRKMVGTKSYTLEIPGRDEPLVFENTNKLMVRTSWVTGVKTGLTPRADQCLVASGTKNGVSMLSVILGQPSTSICWDDSETLLRYGFSQYRHVALLDAGVAVAEAGVPYQLDGKIRLVTERKLEMDLYKEDDVTASVRVDHELTLPVQAGEAFGQVILTIGDETVGSVDLVADKSYAETTLGTKIAYAWDRFARWLGGVF
jgi:D-alanyl-D-alanine carboxypeptidase (penicillin-binding protein 5/6)